MTQLAMQFEPAPSPDPFAEVIAEAERTLSTVLLPCSYELVPSSIQGALAHAAEQERCIDRPLDLCGRIMAGLDLASRRAEEELQHIRGMLAELEGVTVDQLDQHLAAREAEEKRMREEARAEKPARASGGKAAKGSGATIGIGRAALSERQRELLAFVRVEDNVAIFSSEERVPDWDLLKRIMVALGGTWKTGGKKAPGGFRFPDDLDAAELVRLAKETGEITDPKAAEFFATPRPLAELLVERADLDFCSRVLEPSAGLGGIALAARERQPSAHVVCIEALEASAEKLRQLGFDTTCADFLSVTPASLNTFTHVLMNPPFSKRQDIQHVRHAYTFLEPGGVLVAIMSAGVKFRDDNVGKAFRLWVADHDGVIWDNPEGAFLESGTAVRTVMVRVRRPK